MTPNLPKRFIFLFTVVIILAWISIFRDFIIGQIVINVDSSATYGSFKYFYNNLMNGVIPLWEPFVYLGRPHIHLAIAGVLNALVLPVSALHFLGVDYYNIYLIFLLSYVLLGICGFFVLNKMILKNASYALVATAFLIFSGLPAMLFNQVYVVLLFVPVVWFFVFFLKFFTDFKIYQFWGMVCSVMVIAVCYYPFYFLCLTLAFLIFYIMLYPKQFREKAGGLLHFMCSHKTISALVILCVLTAFIPLCLFKITNSTGEILSPARHNCTIKDNCPKQVEMRYDEVAFDGSFGERFAGGTLFSHLDKFNYNDDCLIYVPSFIFIILLLALFTVMDRKRLLIYGTACATLIVALGGATPLYKVLFDNIFFFKYFRNLFFFTAFLIPLAILFATAQLKSLIEQVLDTKLKLLSVALLVVGHIIFLCILNIQGDIIPATYLTLFLSLLFFISLALGFFKDRVRLLLPFLTVLILVEPISVFIHYRNNISLSAYQLPKGHEAPKFEYTRPTRDALAHFGQSLYAMFAQLADFKDATGIVNFQPDFLNSHVFDFYNSATHDQQKNIAKHKIAIYSRSSQKEDGPQGEPAELSQETPELKVLHFDVNSLTLQTRFTDTKYLVYRDAYSVFWKAFINGKESKIELAEGAFKGLNIPAGENVITFKYMPLGGQAIYVFVLFTMSFAFLMLGVFYFNPKYRGSSSC